VRRPVVGDVSTVFPVGRLPAGQFVFAFRLGDEIVRAGRFLSPDRCASEWDHPELFGRDLAVAQSRSVLPADTPCSLRLGGSAVKPGRAGEPGPGG
jgi:hypothetical protein